MTELKTLKDIDLYCGACQYDTCIESKRQDLRAEAIKWVKYILQMSKENEYEWFCLDCNKNCTIFQGETRNIRTLDPLCKGHNVIDFDFGIFDCILMRKFFNLSEDDLK